MLIMFLLTLMDDIFGDLTNSVHSTDIDLMQGNYLTAVLSYCLQANHFFPIDSWLAIALLYSGIYLFFGGLKVVNIIINLIPDGWGVRL